ncbi:hypothetical protein EIP91_010801 [Steccherinum ochraceum]|uniref:Mid2 domain-containing protein n=1 Tax=Steccherinum ochraceum TaxID=92696 RepID=A0A4R0RC54_9APHY|nr:hypothetical protein EIP91_010801 [Steccherinum ochraceum]
MPTWIIDDQDSRMQWSTGWARQNDGSALRGTTTSTTTNGATLKFYFSSADVADATSFPSIIQVIICATSNANPVITVDSQSFPGSPGINSSCPYVSQPLSATSETQQRALILEVPQIDPNHPFSLDYAAITVPVSASAIPGTPQASSSPPTTDPQIPPVAGILTTGTPSLNTGLIPSITSLPPPASPTNSNGQSNTSTATSVTDPAKPTLSTTGQSSDSGVSPTSSPTSRSSASVVGVGLGAGGGVLALVLLGVCSYILWKRSRSRLRPMAVNADRALEFGGDEQPARERRGTFVSPYNMRHSVPPLAEKHALPGLHLDDDEESEPGSSSSWAAPPPSDVRASRLGRNMGVAEPSGGLLADTSGDNAHQYCQQAFEHNEGYSVVPSEWIAPPAYSPRR